MNTTTIKNHEVKELSAVVAFGDLTIRNRIKLMWLVLLGRTTTISGGGIVRQVSTVTEQPLTAP